MFAFNAARTPDELMDELERFIKFWLGPRKPGYGEPKVALDRDPLPGPLRRLYAFAGRWPPTGGRHGHGPNAFAAQDTLAPLSRAEWTDDGRVVFLWENQGCWVCATEPHGKDPPVWVSEGEDEDGGHQWDLVADSLSRFLVSFCLQELMFGARLCLSDDELDKRFAREGKSAVPILTDGVYVDGQEHPGHNFFLWDDAILVGRLQGSQWFAAKDEAGIAFLTGRQSGVSMIHVHLPPRRGERGQSSWYLEITENGGGKVEFWPGLGGLPAGARPASAAVPPGTFDFAAVRDRLLALVAKSGKGRSGGAALFFRRGQGGASPEPLRDPAAATDLFRRALAAAKRPGKWYKQALREHPPLPPG